MRTSTSALISTARIRSLSVCWSCQLQAENTAVTSARRAFSSSTRRGAKRATEKRGSLPTTPARTRFAPSPTGYLHLGSVRTALYNYLLAHKTGGQFLLRIEDTDRKRTVPDAEQRLLEDLRWLGLQWHEGPEVDGPYGPYRQSDRIDTYRHHWQQLLESGKAYRCFCSAEDRQHIAEQRHEHGLLQGYDRTCAYIPRNESDERASKGDAHVLRLFVSEDTTSFTDLVYGQVKSPSRQKRFAAGQYEDPILVKTDGVPTYHLANVIDDHLMHITHVIRGTEWLPSTPQHLELYRAFGWDPPQFAHVGLLTDLENQKMSKRKQDTTIAHYRDQGYLPEAVVNFAALQGWSHDAKSDVLPMDEMVDRFHLKFTKGNSAVQFGKLMHLQREHAKRRIALGKEASMPMIRYIASVVETQCDDVALILGPRSLEDYVYHALRLDAQNFTTPSEFIQRNSYLFHTTKQDSAKDPLVPSEDSSVSDFMPSLLRSLEMITEEAWDEQAVNTCIRKYSPEAENKDGTRAFWKAIRDAATHGQEGMGVARVMAILGRAETLRRFKETYP